MVATLPERARVHEVGDSATGRTGQTPATMREALEEMRSHYLVRLHRRSDDFAATEGLRSVERALATIPRPDGVWAWHRRELEPRPRWWKRRRRRHQRGDDSPSSAGASVTT